MKYWKYRYFTRSRRRYPYPNEAAPGYFFDRIVQGLAALAAGMGTVTVFFCMVIL